MHLQIKESRDLPLLQEFGRLPAEARKSALMLYDPGASYTKFDQIEDISEEERSFLRIVDVNAFGNSSNGNSGLYETICRINHSCAPNAFHIFDQQQGVMEVGTLNEERHQFKSNFYFRDFCQNFVELPPNSDNFVLFLDIKNDVLFLVMTSPKVVNMA